MFTYLTRYKMKQSDVEIFDAMSFPFMGVWKQQANVNQKQLIFI